MAEARRRRRSATAHHIVERVYFNRGGQAGAYASANAVLAAARRLDIADAAHVTAADIQSALNSFNDYSLTRRQYNIKSRDQPRQGYALNSTVQLARPTTLGMDTARFTVFQNLSSPAGTAVFIATDVDFRSAPYTNR